ncbi:moaA/nifB/pqqE family protein [Methanosarcina lacustris Z-7289]|uniref:MoaA/nifB/pqqE family protein n=1 Tax=Methanosarcina lacustris Z-7289 TaxID=1434111 RepID=A0A0E3S751_9EURY|nr:radical SAM protein [Methanosarcina lacustris]AKB76336.1 moaA/nifB/pqqE family protein [Methanosarcina lacustris Z-7289]
MTPEKKNVPESPVRDRNIELFSMPGLSVNLQRHEGRALKLTASGPLKTVCTPILKKMNSHLQEEKPALVQEDRVIPSAWLPPIPGPVFKRLIYAEIQIALGKYIPETVSIELTRQTGSRYPPGTATDELDTGTIKRVIDEALELGTFIITFTENDPLLRDDVLELIEYVDKNRAIVNCSTWGTDFSKETAFKLKEAGLHSLMVGIYSTDPEKHDAHRNSAGAYDRAVSAIKLALEAGLLVVMTTHASPSNMQELPALYALASELGVQEFSVWEAMPKARGEPVLNDSNRETILEMYRRINSDPEGPRMFSNTYFEGKMMGAMAGRRWMHVTTDGDVKPSPYPPFRFGNVKEVTLKEIWQRIRSYPYFQRHKSLSPMNDPEFMEFVDKIPEEAKLPYPFEEVCEK